MIMKWTKSQRMFIFCFELAKTLLGEPVLNRMSTFQVQTRKTERNTAIFVHFERLGRPSLYLPTLSTRSKQIPGTVCYVLSEISLSHAPNNSQYFALPVAPGGVSGYPRAWYRLVS